MGARNKQILDSQVGFFFRPQCEFLVGVGWDGGPWLFGWRVGWWDGGRDGGMVKRNKYEHNECERTVLSGHMDYKAIELATKQYDMSPPPLGI